MEHPALKVFEQQQLRKKYPNFQPGDTVKVNTRVVEGDKERIQVFEGVVISINGGGIGETFKVRKLSYGTGVERTFPIHSPKIESIEIVRRGHVRRAKLYYLRDRIGKATRIQARKKHLNEEHMWIENVEPEAVKPAPVISADEIVPDVVEDASIAQETEATETPETETKAEATTESQEKDTKEKE